MAWASRQAAWLAFAGAGLMVWGLGGGCAKGGGSVDEGDTDTGGKAGSAGQAGDGGSAGSAGNGGSAGGGTAGEGGMPPECDETPCKVLEPQCGCAMGEKCSIDVDMRGCVPSGTAAAGETCLGDGDCGPGTMCLSIGTHSTCHEFCEQDVECAPPGGLCVINLNGYTGPERWCSENCDPVSNAGCPVAGSRCEVGTTQAPDPIRVFSICVPAGAGTQGAACTDFDDCAAGFSCLNDGMTDACRQWCNFANPICPVGTTCAHFNPALLLGVVEYGGCL